MRYTRSYIRTNKSAKELESINATLLTKACFIDQTMAGVYSFLPLGWRVLDKIENIVREEMDTVGAEIFLPALAPQETWQQTGRLETIDVNFEARGANELSRERNDATYVLNSTHEDVLTAALSKSNLSYKDLPIAVYQIQTKFRNEPRPKSGIMRGREFRMKDLYTFHVSDEDRQEYYDRVKGVYVRLFDRLGLGADTVIALASGGDFTKEFSHEFDTKCATGEDTVYYDADSGTYYNKEVAPAEVMERGESFTVAEVGNIFPLGTKFADAFNFTYTDQSGQQQPIWMASYGIGTSRIMGVLAEKFNDDRGLIWPTAVAPFTAHLAALNLDDDAVQEQADAAYEQLQAAGIEVLYDDRIDASPGEKLADADLIGCPVRLVVSAKTEASLEFKQRESERTDMVDLEEATKRLQKG